MYDIMRMWERVVSGLSDTENNIIAVFRGLTDVPMEVDWLKKMYIRYGVIVGVVFFIRFFFMF